MRRSTTGLWHSRASVVAWLVVRRRRGAQQKEVLIGMQCDRTGATQTHRRRAVPGDARLLRPDQCEGRGRRLQDQGTTRSTTNTRSGSGRGLSAPQAGRRRVDDALRHADDRGAEPAARGGQDPDAPRPASASRPRPTARAILTCSRSPRPIGRRAPRPSSSSRTSWAAT